MEILSTNKPKANKDHKCDYCYGKITKGEIYDRQVLKGDYLYTWKSHLRCGSLAYKLRMFDDCDEGVTGDDFHEYITNEYLNLTKDDDVKIPTFPEQLEFICNHYRISNLNQWKQ